MSKAESQISEISEDLKRPNYKDCYGIRISDAFSTEALLSVLNYKPKSGELYIITYPKCGTTWMQFIVMLIIRRGRPVVDAMDYLINSPFIEFTGIEALESMTNPGAIKCHLPFHLMPFSPEAKYIYVARNPMDCCVSFYHHTKMIPAYNFTDGTFDEFFELFIKGETDYGDYFDHHLSWYEHKDEPNIHFMTYEDLKKDTKGEILKIAKFMGEDHYEALISNPDILDNILEYSSIKYMKNNLNDSMDNIFKNNDLVPHNVPSGVKAFREYMAKHPSLCQQKQSEFVRKGIVGDWKNYFNKEQERRMRERIKTKTEGSDLMKLWKDFDDS